MRKAILVLIVLGLLGLLAPVYSQPPMLKRTTTKTDHFDFGAGGTIAIIGSPTGSIRVEGWNKNEVGISAEIEMQATSEADLARLADVTGFVTDESVGRTAIISVGAHDKQGPKKTGKKVPKELIGLPFRIDYVINVPRYCDLEINGGHGDLTVKGVEGSMNISFLETNAKLEIITGSTTTTIGSGKVDVDLGVRGWRSRAATMQLATGDLTVRLPVNTNPEIDAAILKNGKIENTLVGLKPRDRKVDFTDKSIIAKAGRGAK